MIGIERTLACAAPGALRGSELYRAFDRDEEDFATLLGTKLPMPVLAIAGELDNAGGHRTPEESSEFPVAEVLRFLGP